MGKLSQQKKVNRHMVFLPFYSISFRCRLFKVFSFGFVFFASSRAVGFWKVLVRNSKGLCCGRFWLGKVTQQKKVTTPQGFPLILLCRGHSGITFSSFSRRMRRTRGDSSLGPRGTVTELPSGTFPGPLQNPKSKIQNPKSGIQNPKSKIPQSKIQNPNFFGRILGILDFGFWNLDFGFWNAM